MKFSDHAFAWVAGALLVPVAGALATRLTATVVKPDNVPQLGILAAALHGAVGVFAYTQSTNPDVSPAWQSFAEGGAVSEGVSAAFALWAGYKFAEPAVASRITEGGGLAPRGTSAPSVPASPVNPAGPRALPSPTAGTLSSELLQWLAGYPSVTA